MQRATSLFNEEQCRQVEQAVVSAEAQTSCEIVPVVATESGRYDRAEDIVGLWLAVVAAVAVWWYFPRPMPGVGNWDVASEYLGILAMIALPLAAFVAGAIAGSRIGGLRRLFTPRKQMAEEVAAKARAVFFDKRIHHTTGATGLLIYVSLFERRAVVLADEAIVAKLGQKFLDELCEQLTTGLQRGSVVDALCDVIAEAGKQLSAALPRLEGDVDELGNALVLID